MKILLTFILLLNFGICSSQNFIDGIINCSKNWANDKLLNVVGKQLFENNFKLDKSNTIIEVYNDVENKLERLTLKEFRANEFPATQLWLNYKINEKGLLLTELLFPFNLNCTTPWDLKDTEEIIEPYLKVLNSNTKINLKKALIIAKENGFEEITEWDIDYNRNKLVWKITSEKAKSDSEKNHREIILINSKNGKILAKYTEITRY